MKTNLTYLSRKKMIIIVLLIAAIQTALQIGCFSEFKKVFFGDEMYSYATANSSETMSPIIDFDGTLHLNEWLTSDSLMQAVILTKEELLNYHHINEILKTDAHPPLYFYTLHFYSSFFMGRFSWIPSIIINSISIFIMQIFFYRLFLILSEDRYFSMITMIFFGCTSAMINMMTFSRNYTMMTSFTVIFTYFLFKAMQQHSVKEKTGISLLLASFFLYLAAMSQYLSIIFAFFLTLFICSYYLFKKDFKFMFKLGFSMIAAILAMTASFHYVLMQLSSDQSSMELSADYPFLFELRISFHILFNELFGIKTPVHATMIPFWILCGLVSLAVIYLVLLFLFRNDNWFKNINKKSLDFLIEQLKKAKNQRFFQYLSILFSSLAIILIISYKFKIYYFYPNSDRYLFIVYPFFVIILFVPLFRILKNKIAVTALTAVLIGSSLYLGAKPFLGNISQPSVSEVKDVIQDSDIVVFSQNFFAGANLSLLYLEGSNNVFFTTDDSYENNMDKFVRGLSDDNHLYMLYLWPAYSDKDVQEQLLKILKTYKQSGVTTLNDTPKNHGAKLVASLGSFVLIQLR